MKKILLGACVVLGGCQTIGNWADDVGSHLPVLSDERCEHWQCFTEGGREQSEMNKKLMQERWEQEQKEDQAEQEGKKPEDAQQPQKPPAYNPPPEMNPYDNYQQ